MAEAVDKPTRLRLVEAIFHEALQQPPDTRAVFVAQRCGHDPALRREVERLLSADSRGDGFLGAPALGADFIMPTPESLDQATSPRRIGPYQLVRLLDSGGVGHVWLAHRDDEHFQKEVAVKLIKRGMDTDSILERFRHERQVLARLEHANIARLLDGGATEDGLPYLVMEYVNGLPIDRFCQERRLTVNQRLELFREVCSAVQYAHQNLFVHRDIKPGNVLVTAEGRPKLLDFGIAKVMRPDACSMTVTSAEGRLMTPEYASPEQIRGAPITTASDVYSLGVVLYELLTGQMPYAAKTTARGELERLICEAEPVNPSTAVRRAAHGPASSPTSGSTVAWPEGDALKLSRKLHGDLDTILLTALRKEPAARYASVEQFADDLDRYLRRLPVSARAPTRMYRTRRFIQRHKASVAAFALAFLAVVGGMIYSTRAYLRAEREAARSAEVIHFLERMLTSANPTEKMGRSDVTVREFLDNSSKQLESGESKLGPEVEAIVRLTIGRTYLGLDLLPEAERHLRVALDLHRRYLDPKDGGVIQSLHSLGRVLRQTRRPAEAEQCQREVLRMCREATPEPSGFVAQSLNSLAILLREQGKLEEAEATFQDAVDTYRKALGPDHPGVADTLRNLGSLMLVRGRPEQAEPVLREALAIHARQLGEHSWEAVADRLKLADAVYGRGSRDDAVALLRETLNANAELPGPAQHMISQYQITLAGWLEVRGELFEAEGLLRAGLPERENLLGPHHRDVAAARVSLARILETLGRWEEADCLLLEAGITPPSESPADAP